jgi:hypothetical protein
MTIKGSFFIDSAFFLNYESKRQRWTDAKDGFGQMPKTFVTVVPCPLPSFAGNWTTNAPILHPVSPDSSL